MSASPTTMTVSVTSVTINDLPDELLELISISAGSTEYCNFRRAMKRVWEYTTGREDHCIKHFLITKVDKRGTRTTLCGKLHSMFDLPATIWPGGGLQLWYQHGKRHRDNDLPATICSDGGKYWYQHGKYHRDNDLPAVIKSNGTQTWYHRGEVHRNNDQPAITWADGTQFWYRHGTRRYTP